MLSDARRSNAVRQDANIFVPYLILLEQIRLQETFTTSDLVSLVPFELEDKCVRDRKGVALSKKLRTDTI